MNCEKFRSNIAAFLAGELDERSSEEHRRHAEECSNCAAELKSTAILVDTLRTHWTKDVPARAEARVLNSIESLRGKHRKQKPSPVPLGSRAKGAFTMKRRLVAVGLVVVAAILGLGILPSRNANAVLAQVAEAMANIKSVHLTGFWINTQTGERNHFEVWIKQPAKYREIIEWNGGVIHDTADDGSKMVALGKWPGNCSATMFRLELPEAGKSSQTARRRGYRTLED